MKAEEGYKETAMTISKSFSLSAGTNESFIQGLYGNLFWRVPDDIGASFWTAALTHGLSRDQAVADFLLSSEYLERHADQVSYVTALYEDLLHRDPDPNGLKYWTESLKSNVAESAVVNAFLSSSEFSNLIDPGTPGLLFSRDVAGTQVISLGEVFREIEGDAQSAQLFYVQLKNAPAKDVTVYLETTDLKNGLLQDSGRDSQSSRINLKFTPENWATGQAFKAFAGNDGVANFGQNWKVFALTNSQDDNYHYIRPNNTGEVITIEAINVDKAGVNIRKLDFDLLSSGQSGSVGMVLTSKPNADVYLYVHGLGGHFNIDGSPAFEEQVFKFTPENWNVEQKAVLQYANPLFDAASAGDKIVVDIRSIDQQYGDLANKNYTLPVASFTQPSVPTNSIQADGFFIKLNEPHSAQTTITVGDIDSSIITNLKQAATFLNYTFDNASLPLIGSLKSNSAFLLDTIQKAVDAAISSPNTAVNDDMFIYDATSKNFTLTIKETVALPSVQIASDLGVNGLSFKAAGNIEAVINCDLVLKGGWNSIDNFYLDQTTSKYTATLDLNGNNLTMDGLLGPLSISASNQISKNAHKSRTDTGASIKADLSLKQDEDGKLTLSEAQKIITAATPLTDAVNFSFDGAGQLSFAVKTKTTLPMDINSAIEQFIPTYSFDLTAPFSVNYNALAKNADGSPVKTSLAKVYIDNPQINIADFTTNTLKPFVNEINISLKSIIGISDYFLKATGPWQLQDFGASFAAEFTSGWDGIFGRELAEAISDAINAVSKSVDGGYQTLFKAMDNVSLYNHTTSSQKDGLISPLELLRSSANFYYNLANDGANTANKMMETVKASLEAAGFGSGIINEVNTALVDLINKEVVNNPQSKNIASSAIVAVDKFQSTLEQIQKIKDALTTVNAIEDIGYIKFENQVIDISASGNSKVSVSNVNLTGEIKAAVDQLKTFGFDFPVLQNSKFLIDTIQGNQSDIATYEPKIEPITFPQYQLPFSVLKALGLPDVITKYLDPQLDINFSNQITFGANVAAGIDNQALLDWLQAGANTSSAARLSDSFYIKDVNAPEFYANIVTKLSADGSITNQPFTFLGEPYEKGDLTANGSIYLRALTKLEADIKDAGSVSGVSDGKVRPSEIGATLADFGIPFTGALNTDLYAGFNFNGYFGIIPIGHGTPTETSLGSIGLQLT